MSLSYEVLNRLRETSQSEVSTNHPLAEACTFRIGGPAAYFSAPASTQALKACAQWVRQEHFPLFILAGGSNVLFSDEGFPGVVLSTRHLNSIQRTETGVVVAAGVTNDALTAFTVAEGLSGFEWACGLPGTVAGGVFMNAKCYGGSFSDLVESATGFDLEGRDCTVPAAECGFAYKDSVFQHNGFIITEVRLRLTAGTPAAIRAAGETNRQDRIAKGQFAFPSAGCAFKNAYAINTPAGKLIEGCGLKGHAIGGAAIYERHANFIVNQGQARAADVLALVALAKQRVWEKFQYRLEEEIQIVP